MPQGLFKPLKNIRVLDFTRLLPGPFCSYLLAGSGARVTVVEHPTEREVLSFPPVKALKKFLKLDLKSGKGLQKAKALVKRADVLMEGFRRGVLERLGLGFREARKIQPHIVYCSLTGYGQAGGAKAGHDLNYLSVSGLLSALAAGRELRIPGVPLADLVGGFSAAFQIAAALSVPKRRAVHLDVSICQAAEGFLVPLDGEVQKAIGPVFNGSLARYQLYSTGDGKHLAVAPLEEKFWKSFVEKMKIPSEVLTQGEARVAEWLKARFKEKSRD